MPWCVACARFLSPSTVRPDGTCPACGRPVDPGRARPPGPAPTSSDPAGVPPTPQPGVGRNRVAGTARSVPYVGGAGADSGRPATEATGRSGEGRHAGDRHGGDLDGEDPDDEEMPPVPWHLKALAGGLLVYLGYRFMQGLEWIWKRLG